MVENKSAKFVISSTSQLELFDVNLVLSFILLLQTPLKVAQITQRRGNMIQESGAIFLETKHQRKGTHLN